MSTRTASMFFVALFALVGCSATSSEVRNDPTTIDYLEVQRGPIDDPCLACLQPPAELPCVAAACSGDDDQCLWINKPAGTGCNDGMVRATCDGRGKCGELTCDKASDCPAPPPCYVVRCNDTIGPDLNKCQYFPYNDEKRTGTCDIVTSGSMSDACHMVSATSVAYKCSTPGGPALGPGACTQADPLNAPDAWCCDLL